MNSVETLSETTRTTTLRRWRFMGVDVDGDIAGLTLPGGCGGPVAVTIREARLPIPEDGKALRVYQPAGPDEPCVAIREGSFGLVYEMEGTGRFWIEPDGAKVHYELCRGASPSDIDHLVSGPVLGLALQMQGRTLLHAGAVSVGGRAVAFSGQHGAGKSTLSTSFVGAGYPLITDDLLGLQQSQGTWYAIQSVPRIKLWRDSLDAMLDPNTPTSEVLTWAPKRRVAIGTDWGTSAPERTPLAAIYFLRPMKSALTVPSVVGLDATDAGLLLISGMYSADVLRGARAAGALGAAAAIAESIPVRAVSYYRSFENLPAIREAILRDVEGLSA